MFPEYEFIAYGMGDGKIEKFLKEQVEPRYTNFKFNGFLDRYKNHKEVFSKAIAFCQFSRLQVSDFLISILPLSNFAPPHTPLFNPCLCIYHFMPIDL